MSDNTYLKDFFDWVSKNELDVGFGLFENDSTSNRFRTKLVMKWLNFMGKVSAKRKYNFYGTMANVIIKKEVFKKVGGFREDMSHFEDIDFVKRLKKENVIVGIVPMKVKISGRRYNRILRVLLGSVLAAIVIGTFGTILLNEKLRKKILSKASNFYGKLGG